jgi:hypothetical protein
MIPKTLLLNEALRDGHQEALRLSAWPLRRSSAPPSPDFMEERGNRGQQGGDFYGHRARCQAAGSVSAGTFTITSPTRIPKAQSRA